MSLDFKCKKCEIIGKAPKMFDIEAAKDDHAFCKITCKKCGSPARLFTVDDKIKEVLSP